MATPNKEKWNADLEQLIRETLASIRFGTLTLVVQDGLVIQVDKNEKTRLGRHGHIHGSGI